MYTKREKKTLLYIHIVEKLRNIFDYSKTVKNVQTELDLKNVAFAEP